MVATTGGTMVGPGAAQEVARYAGSGLVPQECRAAPQGIPSSTLHPTYLLPGPGCQEYLG